MTGAAEVEQADEVIHVHKGTPTHFSKSPLRQATQKLKLWATLMLGHRAKRVGGSHIGACLNVRHKEFIETDCCAFIELQCVAMKGLYAVLQGERGVANGQPAHVGGQTGQQPCQLLDKAVIDRAKRFDQDKP